jgi:hypothetical protein
MQRDHRKSRNRAAILFGAFSCLTALSCGSKGAVAVTAVIESPELSVDQSSGLGAQLTGRFRLHLELGQLAPSGTDVSISQGNFNLVAPGGQTTLVLLKFTTSPAAPYHLEPGGKLDIAFTVADKAGSSGQFLSKDEEAAVCASRAAVQIAGSISDSAGGTTPVASSSFAVTRCP